MNRIVRVVIVEDQWMVRDGLAALAEIADNIEVVATGADGLEAVALAAEHQPDIVLMDIKMPNLDGIEATRQIVRSHPKISVLVLTTFEQDDLIRAALEAGAIGYLTKDIAAADLAQSITAAANGVVQLSRGVTASLLPGGSGGKVDPETRTRLDALTPRERDVLHALATGATNREIGHQLHLSAGTVKNHVSSILRQLGTTDRTRAALMASRHGFGELPR